MPLANPHICIRCHQRADGAWFCRPCARTLAKRTPIMDDVELRACQRVAESIVVEGEISLKAEELADFIAWCVREFGECIRRDLEEGGPPF